MPYLGNEPATVYTSTTKDSFSGDASTTDFTLSKAGNNNSLRVVVENVVQDPGVAYTCVGTTLSFTSAPPTGTNNIYVVHLGPPAATIAPPSTINNATTFTSNVTLKSEVPEDTDGGRGRGIDFQGTQSGGEVSKLAQILASHDGTADDEKGKISFKTNDGNDSNSPTERWLITSEGHFKAAANGYGIDFSATEGSGAVTNGSILDDYEEGTWTPVIRDGITGNAAGMASQDGLYTKIGNLVYIIFQLQINSVSGMTGSNQCHITGLPFTVNNDLGNGAEPSGGIITYINNLDTANYGLIFARANNGSTDIEIKYTGTSYDTGGAGNFLVNNFDSGADTFMTGSVMYRV